MREDWVEIELNKISTKITDGTHHTPTYTDSGVYFISVKDIYNGKVNFQDTKFISVEEHKELIKRCKPEYGDLLITKSGTIGRMAIVPKTPEFSLFVSVALIKNRNEIILSKFLMYVMEDYLKSISISQVIKGGVLKNFHLEDIRKTSVHLPPLPIQRAIVTKIENLFASLDKGIADLKKAQEQLKIYRQAVLKKAFEGKLSGTVIENDEHDKHDEKENHDHHKNHSPDNLPKGWKWATIFDFLCDNKKGMTTGPFGTALKKHEHQKTGIPVLGIENIGEGVFQLPNKIFVTDEKANELKSFVVLENDIIISRSGTVGEICSVPKSMEGSLISTNLIRVRLNLDEISPKFFVYLFQGGNVREQVKELCKGSTRVFLNQTILKSLKLPYCSKEEQHQIVREIESRLSVCDKVEQNITEALNKSEALRQSILKKVFEGKLLSETEIEKCKQEADYEPASILLQRIKGIEVEKPKKKPAKQKTEKEKPATPKISKDKQAGVIAKVIKLHEDNPKYLCNLSHVKCEKISHLAEYHIQIALGRTPVKDAAGPDDFSHLKKVEHRAKMTGYFLTKKQEIGHTYQSGRNINKAIDNLENKITTEQVEQLDKLINLFLQFDLERAEIVATVYAGWNNLLLDGKTPTDDEIVYESRENWSKRKLKIERERFYKALAWMRKPEVALIPQGNGLRVNKPEKRNEQTGTNTDKSVSAKCFVKPRAKRRF